jgi:RecB family endonuclease NucS
VTKIFNSQPLEDRDKLAQLVADHATSLEKNLRVVDPGKGRGKWGPMDLLAVDGKGYTVIIDVSPRTRDDLLVEGLSHLSWFDQYRHQVAPPREEQAEELFVPPRLILVAPDFSDRCQKAVAALENVRIDLYRLRWLQSDDEEGLLIEPVYSSAGKEKTAGELTTHLAAVPGMVQLGEEEIASFMKTDLHYDL